MSELSETIDRLEAWVNVRPSDPAGFIADLRALIATAKAAQRALQVLQKAQRHEQDYVGDIQPCSFGDWLLFDDVSQAIKILQEGQQ